MAPVKINYQAPTSTSQESGRHEVSDYKTTMEFDEEPARSDRSALLQQGAFYPLVNQEQIGKPSAEL